MSLKLLADLVVLLLVLGMTAIALLGWGNLTWRLLGIEQPNKPSVLTVWLGFCVVVGCIEIIHLLVPVDWKVTCAFALIGLIGYGLNSKLLISLKDSRSTAVLPTGGILSMIFSTLRRYPLRSLLAAIVVIVWCLRAMEVPTMYDSGLYHFGSIRWLNEFPIVPGLGNVHWRLALNQSYFGFLALLNIAPFWGKGYASGGLFLLVLTAFTLFEVGKTQSQMWRWVFGGALFSYLCLLSSSVANPLPDTGVALLQITIFIFLFVNYASDTKSDATSSVQAHHLQIVLALLCLTIVTVKLSSVGFAIASFWVVGVWALRSKPHKLSSTVVIRIIAVLASFTAVHICRSYVLSGAPFFPSPVGGLWTLPWSVEYGVAQNESQLIYAWAKQPGIAVPSELKADLQWFPDWFARLPLSPLLLMLTGTFFIILQTVIAFGWPQSKITVNSRSLWLLVVPLFTAILFWWLTAPDIRFLGAIVVLYFVYASWFLAVRLKVVFKSDVGEVHFYRIGLAIRLLICLLTAILFTRWALGGIKTVSGWQPLPVPTLAEHVTRGGVNVVIPTSDGQCWNARLPCAVFLHDGLSQHTVDFLGAKYHIKFDRSYFTTRP
jgi:hypothetical protein